MPDQPDQTKPAAPVMSPQADLPPLPMDTQPETKKEDAPSGNPPAPEGQPVISSVPKKKFGTGKIIATILGILLLVGGVGAGIFLTNEQQLFKQSAHYGTPILPPTVPPAQAKCSSIKVYDINWLSLTEEQLGQQTPSTIVNFCVSGIAENGSFDMAKFQINEAEYQTTSINPNNSNEFCQEYTLPEGGVIVNAQIHHTTGWK